MKTVIQDLKGNILFYEEIPFTSTSHTFFTTNDTLVRLTYQWEPDRLLILDYIEEFVHNGITVSSISNKQVIVDFLSFYFNILLVEDIAMFRKEGMSSYSGAVYVSDDVTDAHIEEVKALYNTSNWIWP